MAISRQGGFGGQRRRAGVQLAVAARGQESESEEPENEAGQDASSEQKFGRTLRKAEEIVCPTGLIIRLEKGTYFMGKPVYHDRLFVRPVFSALKAQLEYLDTTGGMQGVLVLGTPGSGKSMFGFWMMYKWHKEGRRVLLRKSFCLGANRDYISLSKNGNFEALDFEEAEEAMNDPNVRVICDGVNPQIYPGQAKILLIEEHGSEVELQNYVKAYGYTKRFFSVWFLRELQDAQAALEHVAAPKDADKKSMQAKLIESEAGMEFKDPDEHSLEGQYNRYGGLPRFTLEKFDDVREISSSVLRSAISLAGVEDMEHYVTLNYKPSSVLNRVFHINAYNQLDRPIPRFASKLIAGMFVQAKDLDKQLRFLEYTANKSFLRSIRTQIYGPLALRVIKERHMQLEYRQLTDDTTGPSAGLKSLPNFGNCNWHESLSSRFSQAFNNTVSDSGANANAQRSKGFSKIIQIVTMEGNLSLESIFTDADYTSESFIELYLIVPPTRYSSFSALTSKDAGPVTTAATNGQAGQGSQTEAAKKSSMELEHQSHEHPLPPDQQPHKRQKMSGKTDKIIQYAVKLPQEFAVWDPTVLT